MGRWLPAILLFGLTTLCSCAEEPDNAYPGNTQNKALKAWMTQNRPDLLENYQEEGEYYVDVVSLGDLADSAILETESWVWYDITGRDLQGNISVARDSVYALQQELLLLIHITFLTISSTVSWRAELSRRGLIWLCGTR